MSDFVPRSELIAVCAALAITVASATWSAPKRVVSMNLCTDQLAMMLAAPGQLHSVSWIAFDPASSSMTEEAANYVKNRGRAEEIFDMDPDLVLAGRYSDSMAVSMLRNLGVEVVQFDLIESLDEIPAQVRQMGAVLGQVPEAEALAQKFQNGLSELDLLVADEKPTAAFFYANGYSLGIGTLSHDIVLRAGFANLAEQIGRAGGGRLALEEVIFHQPDLLITAEAYGGNSRSEAIMDHEALDHIPRVTSSSNWVCGTPLTLQAVQDMVRTRESLEK